MRSTVAAAALLALLASACGQPSVEPPASTLAAAEELPRACALDSPAQEPVDERIVAAYPDEPAAWHPAIHGEAAAVDLVSLWGLPLYTYDASGQLRAGLVREAVVLGSAAAGWEVRLILCPGRWSDGEPVVPADVVATIEALRDSPSAARMASIASARVDGPDVVVAFDGPTSRWQHALADLWTVLPAHVLADQGLEAWEETITVSGGRYRLDVDEPGLRRVFVASQGSPLGSPATRTIEVLLVPRFELALGLLGSATIDIALGHLALEVGPRVEDVGGLEWAVARGGSLLTWQWQEGTSVADPVVRDGVHRTFALDAFAEGLLGETGDVTTSWVPGARGPAVDLEGRLPPGVGELVVTVDRWHEVPSLLARAVRDAIERRGGTVRTASEEADALARAPFGDARIVQRRLGSWPSLLAWTSGSPPEALVTADRAPSPHDAAVLAGQSALRATAGEVPLVELGIPHVWRPELTGVVPSGWPGIGFASAGQWGLSAD